MWELCGAVIEDESGCESKLVVLVRMEKVQDTRAEERVYIVSEMSPSHRIFDNRMSESYCEDQPPCFWPWSHKTNGRMRMQGSLTDIMCSLISRASAGCVSHRCGLNVSESAPNRLLFRLTIHGSRQMMD